jgi:hypothetical protein
MGNGLMSSRIGNRTIRSVRLKLWLITGFVLAVATGLEFVSSVSTVVTPYIGISFCLGWTQLVSL